MSLLAALLFVAQHIKRSKDNSRTTSTLLALCCAITLKLQNMFEGPLRHPTMHVHTIPTRQRGHARDWKPQSPGGGAHQLVARRPFLRRPARAEFRDAQPMEKSIVWRVRMHIHAHALIFIDVHVRIHVKVHARVRVARK